MDEISPLIALPFNLGRNLISDESVFATCVDISGIDHLIIANTTTLFSEPSMTKVPLDNRNSNSTLPQNGVVINCDKAKQSESFMIFGNPNDQELGKNDPTALDASPLGGIMKKSESWVDNLVSVEESGGAVNVAGPPKRTYSASLVEVSDEMNINKQVFPLNFPPLWGSTSVCGRRQEMEDSFVALPQFLKIPSQMLSESPLFRSINQDLIAHLFGVYDGHGGSQVANYCQEHLHLALAEEIGFAKENLHTINNEHNLKDLWLKIFLNCFHRMDDEVGGFSTANRDDNITSNPALPPVAPESVGSTAVVAVVCSSHIIVGNCGDSRAVLYHGKVPVPLSVDHKPNRDDECARIEGAGGKVINWDGYRVSGVLAVSRSIGDRYLRPYVIADPEVMFVPRTKEDECLILASDGLWDVMTNEEACDFARRRILLWHKKNGPTLSKERGNDIDPAAQDAADFLSQLAFQRGSRDNISVIVVDLKAQRKFKRKT